MKSKKFTIIDEIPDLDSVVFEEEITLLKDVLCSVILEWTSTRNDANLIPQFNVETKPKETRNRESGLICSGKH